MDISSNDYCRFFSNVEISPSFGMSDILNENFQTGEFGKNRFNDLSFHSTNGIELKNRFWIGLGLGLQLIQVYRDQYDMILFPISLDTRLNLLSKVSSPYVNLRVGYSVGKSKIGFSEISGGFNLNTSIGFRLFILNNISTNLGIGYQIVGRKYNNTFSSDNANGIFSNPIFDSPNPVMTLWNQFITINVGFTFHGHKKSP